MEIEPEDLNSCSVQHLTEQPSRSWQPERLREHVQRLVAQIVEGEKQIAPLYWHLGMALNLARKDFNHGQWTAYLKSLNVEKTRAARAQAIFQTFSTEAEVQGLTVQEAYNRRKRRSAMEHDTQETLPSRKSGTSLRRKLMTLSKEVSDMGRLAKATPPGQRQQLCQRVGQLIEDLQHLQQLLGTQMEASTVPS